MGTITVLEALSQAQILERRGCCAEAAHVAELILQCVPGHAGALTLLARLDVFGGQAARGAEYARQAIAACPNSAEAYCVLGRANSCLGGLEDAIAAHEKAVSLDPTNPDLQVALGSVLWQACRISEAYAAFRRAHELEPGNPRIHSNLAIASADMLSYQPQQIYEAHREWARTHGDPLAREIRPHTNNPDPERPLRIGYVTPPFSKRAAAIFLEPLFAAHERQQFQVICYFTVPYPMDDPGYQRWRRYPHYWLDVSRHTDEQLTELIRRDGIDILVDTAGHTYGNRLLVFARKPAPVQVTYIGYQETTGLSTIDYRISDAYADPPGMTERHFSEKIVRLPRAGYCYRAPDERPGVSDLPARKNGYVTFGSTNRVSKMSPETVESWSRVLRQVPGSKMIIRADGLELKALQQHVLKMFAPQGIGRERLELLGKVELREYLETFQRIDVVLDCFPFNGHTVSCHALWMGVPVVSRVGQTHTSRMGLSILSNLGLAELTAADNDQFVSIATGLANDLPRLEALRRTLRVRMETSPLMDQHRFGCDMAVAYRQMWRHWCQQVAGKPAG
jgi:protein O-GlcNAc transferase